MDIEKTSKAKSFEKLNNDASSNNVFRILDHFHGLKKVVVAPIIGIVYVSLEICKMSERIKIGDKSLQDRLIDMNIKSELEREEKPLKWAFKKLINGTIKGIIGGYTHR